MLLNTYKLISMQRSATKGGVDLYKQFLVNFGNEEQSFYKPGFVEENLKIINDFFNDHSFLCLKPYSSVYKIFNKIKLFFSLIFYKKLFNNKFNQTERNFNKILNQIFEEPNPDFDTFYNIHSLLQYEKSQVDLGVLECFVDLNFSFEFQGKVSKVFDSYLFDDFSKIINTIEFMKCSNYIMA